VHSWRHRWPVELMCRVLEVSERGYRSWRSRPISRRERTDMKVLAHIREQYSLSLGSYGRPRMTMELKEAGLDVGERRVGRLMTRRAAKPTSTGSSQSARASTRSRPIATIAWGSQRTGWTATSPPIRPTVSGRATSPISGPQKAGSTLPSFSTCTADVSLVGQSATG
jgi:hypothetical protein